MESVKRNSKRGRPPSTIDGADKAFDEIEGYKTAECLNNHALALRFNMTPSTVNRALASRESAAWTPGLRKIYRNVQIKIKANITTEALLRRLLDYKGPGDAIVRRIIQDVDELVVAMGDRK